MSESPLRRRGFILQIINGKFFTADELEQIMLRHNRWPKHPMRHPERPFAQYFRNICWIVNAHEHSGKVFPWLYEVGEKLEAVRPDGTREFLITAAADYLMQDLAAVVVFARL